MTDLHFRKTTADDYDDVVSIRKHSYDGLDYIPSRYLKLLENNTGFAGYINNSIVCFMFAAVINGGNSVFIQSIRVRKEYEGQGFYSQLREFCMKNLRLAPNKSVFVVHTNSAYRKLLERSAKLIVKRQALVFTATKTFLQSSLASRNVSNSLGKVDAQYLNEVFVNQSATRHLFPENRIVVKCVPYMLLSQNIEHMLSGVEMIATADVKQITLHAKYSPISAVTSVQSEAGTVIYLDVFGDINNKKIISDHINAHLKTCLDSCVENIVLYITHQVQKVDDTLLHVLSELGWKKMYSEVLYGLEKTICKCVQR